MIHSNVAKLGPITSGKALRHLSRCFLLESTRPDPVKCLTSRRATKVELLIFILAPVLPQQEDLIMGRCLSGVAAG